MTRGSRSRRCARRATRADDFLAETRFHNVRKVVHVEAATATEDPVRETRWLQTFADRLEVPHGVMAALDLTREDAAEQLSRHAEHANLRASAISATMRSSPTRAGNGESGRLRPTGAWCSGSCCLWTWQPSLATLWLGIQVSHSVSTTPDFPASEAVHTSRIGHPRCVCSPQPRTRLSRSLGSGWSTTAGRSRRFDRGCSSASTLSELTARSLAPTGRWTDSGAPTVMWSARMPRSLRGARLTSGLRCSRATPSASFASSGAPPCAVIRRRAVAARAASRATASSLARRTSAGSWRARSWAGCRSGSTTLRSFSSCASVLAHTQ